MTVPGKLSLWTVIAMSLFALVAGPATAAEGPGLDTLRFRLEPLPGGVLGVGGATVHPVRSLRGSLLIQGEHAPVLFVVDEARESPVIGDRVTAELGMSVGLGKGIALWSGFPLVAYQSGAWPDPDTRIAAWGPGDLRFGGAFRLLDAESAPVGICLRPGLQVPTGMRGAFASSAVVEGLAAIGLETRPGPVRVVSTLGARFHPPSEWSGLPGGSAFTYGLGAEVRLHARWHVAAAWAGEVAGSRWENPMELRLGGTFQPADGVDVGAMFGFGVAPGYGSPDVRFGVQIDLFRVVAPPTAVVESASQQDVDTGVTPLTVVRVPAARQARADAGYVELLIASPVRFRAGETELSEEAREALFGIGAYLNDHPELSRVVVLGHGDVGGGIDYDSHLRHRRAVATSKFLTDEAGVPAELLTIPGEGEADGLLAERSHRARPTSVSFIVARDVRP